MDYRNLLIKIIKIAIADDHKLFREGLRTALRTSKNCKIVMEAGDGEELLRLLRESAAANQPEVILLDIQMPVLDGIQTAEILRTEYPSIKVIVVSMHTDEGMVVRMLRLGVCGYLNKNIDAEELLTAIGEVRQGKKYFSTLVMKTAMNYLSAPDSVSRKLSRRELDVIKMIFQEKTSEEMANDLRLSKRTVDTFVATIMTKLQVNSRVGIVLAALRNKIVNLEGDPIPPTS